MIPVLSKDTNFMPICGLTYPQDELKETMIPEKNPFFLILAHFLIFKKNN